MFFGKRLKKIATAELPTEFGKFQAMVYFDKKNKKEHFALTLGDFSAGETVLVRLHSECLTGEVFHSLKCDCGSQLTLSLKKISEAGKGVLVYLRQEGRGIGLGNKIKAYDLQDHGLDTVDANLKLGFAADERNYSPGALILRDLGIASVNLLTNNPDKIVGLENYGIAVKERLALEVAGNGYNNDYLKTKKNKLGHLLVAPGK